MRPAVLLDASAFIAGYDASDVRAEHYTVPSVRDELLGDGLIRLRFDTALEAGKIRLLAPADRYVDEVEGAAAKLGERRALSRADKELLALGLQLKAEGKSPTIVSDDYSVQNAADLLDLEYKGLATMGIKRRFDWTIYCPGCRQNFIDLKIGEACPVCGTLLKRRPIGKRPARGVIGASGA